MSTNREHRDRSETLRVAGFAYVERVVASVFQLPEPGNDRPFRRPTTRTIREPRRSIADRTLLSGCSAADMPLLFLAVFSVKACSFKRLDVFPAIYPLVTATAPRSGRLAHRRHNVFRA